MKSGIVHKYVMKIVPCYFCCRIVRVLVYMVVLWHNKTEVLVVANEEVVLQVGVNIDITESV